MSVDKLNGAPPVDLAEVKRSAVMSESVAIKQARRGELRQEQGERGKEMALWDEMGGMNGCVLCESVEYIIHRESHTERVSRMCLGAEAIDGQAVSTFRIRGLCNSRIIEIVCL